VISRLAPGESITIRDRDVQLDPTYLNGLDEAEKGLIKLRLVQGETLIAEATHEIRMLARDEWGGMNSMAELLAELPRPLLMFCRSGARSARLFQAASAP
jgi:hypothetical protein